MVQAIDDLFHHLAQVLEIQKQTCRVEFLARKGYPDLVVVPMWVLALSLVAAQVVACGKLIFDGDFVHVALGGETYVVIVSLE